MFRNQYWIKITILDYKSNNEKDLVHFFLKAHFFGFRFLYETLPLTINNLIQ